MAQKKVPVPYSDSIPAAYRDDLVEGKVDVTIKGKLEYIAGTNQKFTISLADGATLKVSKTIAISLEGNFFEGDKDHCKLVLSYKKDGKEEKYPDIDPLEGISCGYDFTIVISVKTQTFGINVNGTQLEGDFDRYVDLNPINRIIVEGDNLTLYDPEYKVRQS